MSDTMKKHNSSQNAFGGQEAFLADLKNNQTPVSIYLKSGIRLNGVITYFDKHTVLLESNTTQIIYKHAISTIMLV